MIPAFKDAAEELLSTSGLSAVEILAKALAKAAVSSEHLPFACTMDMISMMLHEKIMRCILLQGYSDIKERSLLTGMEGYVTLLIESDRPMYTPS